MGDFPEIQKSFDQIFILRDGLGSRAYHQLGPARVQPRTTGSGAPQGD